MERKLLNIEHRLDMKIIEQKQDLAKLKKDKRMEDRLRKIEDDTEEIQMDIKVTSVRVLIVAKCTSSIL